MSCFRKIVNTDNWKNKKYVIWTMAVPSALFGYFVPYVHIVSHLNRHLFNIIDFSTVISVQVAFVKNVIPDSGGSGKTLVTCIGITSLVGRIIFGKIADIKGINRLFLQQV